MCGISGIYNYDNSSVNLDILKKLNEVIEHRGRDDAGSVLISSYCNLPAQELNNHLCSNIKKNDNRYNIGFSHRRLSIIDLSAMGHQPMSDTNNEIWIIFNGEIYNHEDIRLELKKKGFQFKSSTDTEVIIYAYKAWGIECIKKFKGVFAFALWDNRDSTFFLVRDRMGVKPLYYTSIDGSFYFASEIKALLKIPHVQPCLNYKMLSYYFSFLAIPAPDTLFQNILKLVPGTYLKITKNGKVSKTKYWDSCENYQDSKKSVDYYIHHAELILKKAIKSRMMSDVPSGVFLSGGVDSSLIVAIMSEYSSQPINTFTVGYKGLEKSNEFFWAKRISDKYKTNHTELIIDVQNTEEIIRDMVYYQDEPIADPVCIPVLLLARKAKELGISVVHVGEGADEIFAGYKNFKTYYNINEKLWRNSAKIPISIKKVFGFFGKSILSKSKYRKYTDYFDFFTDNKELYWSNTHKYYPSDLDRILKKEYIDPYEFILDKATKYEASGNKNFLSKMTYQELNLRLPELLLMRVDKMTMASTVEGRVPFLDHELVEFGLNIPDSFKMKNKQTKYVIKKIAEKYLPNDIIYRKKVGFGFPIKEFFSGDFKSFLYKTIFNSGLRQEGVINYEFVLEMFKLSESNKVNYYTHIWSLANLSMWYDLWFKNK